jgi:hypothetical protein
MGTGRFEFFCTIVRPRSVQILSAAIVVALIQASISGQTPTIRTPPTANKSSKPAPSTMGRTPWGHPDLEGTWDAATLTPLERPASAGGKLALTKEQAEAIAQRERQINESDARPSDPNREAPPVGGNVGGYNQFFFDRGSSANMVDGQYRSSIIIEPADGKIPPMTPEAQARDAALGGFATRPEVVERRGADEREPGGFDNPENRPLSEQCILGFGWTSGTPMLPNYFYNNGKQIVQTPDTVLIFAEMIHDARVVRLNSQHPPPQIRKWTGDSIGHWEGNTLVVETTNFTNKTRFYGSSENLKVTERFRRVDENNLLYQFTVEDPSTWAQPWRGEYTWQKTNDLLYEYACHEANYSLVGVLRGARARDKEAATKSAEGQK